MTDELMSQPHTLFNDVFSTIVSGLIVVGITWVIMLFQPSPPSEDFENGEEMGADRGQGTAR